MQIEWKEFKEVASEVFHIWVGGPELLWAEDSWTRLASEGLTTYENRLEKAVVLIRFLVLGTIYHEFCHLAFGEIADVDYISWVQALDRDELPLNAFRLGQLVGPFFMVDDSVDDLVTEEELLLEAIGALVNQEREVVVQSLTNSFGGSSLLWRGSVLGDFG